MTRTASNPTEEQRLLRRYHHDGDVAAREALIARMLPLVRHIARRYANRGEPLDDLVQVGCVGLIKAIDRFDLERGLALSTFAAPNIAGEIKRHFRDHGWAMRVPRDLQELTVKLGHRTEELTRRLGRSPTPEELAQELGVTVERVLEAVQCGRDYSPHSLHDRDPEGRGFEETLGFQDGNFADAERRAMLERAMPALGEREREILALRFVEDLTQREIAERIGISQMHVSRLIRRSLERLRESIGEPDAAPATLLRRVA